MLRLYIISIIVMVNYTNFKLYKFKLMIIHKVLEFELV